MLSASHPKTGVSTCFDQVAAMLSTNQQPWRSHKGASYEILWTSYKIYLGGCDLNVVCKIRTWRVWHWSSSPEVDGLITWWILQVKSIGILKKKVDYGNINSPNRKQNMKQQVLKLNTYITISNKGPTCLKKHSFQPSDLVWELCP